jgi:hypothetical protein
MMEDAIHVFQPVCMYAHEWKSGIGRMGGNVHRLDMTNEWHTAVCVYGYKASARKNVFLEDKRWEREEMRWYCDLYLMCVCVCLCVCLECARVEERFRACESLAVGVFTCLCMCMFARACVFFLM